MTKKQLGLPQVLLCCPLLHAGCALLGCPAAALAGCAGPADNNSLQQDKNLQLQWKKAFT